jgi:hypothetical protein
MLHHMSTSPTILHPQSTIGHHRPSHILAHHSITEQSRPSARLVLHSTTHGRHRFIILHPQLMLGFREHPVCPLASSARLPTRQKRGHMPVKSGGGEQRNLGEGISRQIQSSIHRSAGLW